jgi:hydrogenase expression/formation protein HypD
MKYVDEYRDGALARGVAERISAEVAPGRAYRFMEFCGGHTHAISRYGIEDLLPASIRMIHGPGCPVCVLPMGRVDAAIALAQRPDVTLATYGDVMRVPGSNGASLLSAKAGGADVRMVYSTLDAQRIAEDEPDRQVVFLAIGFETTTPPTAAVLRRARERGCRNFSVFCNHVLTPPAMGAILADEDSGAAVALDGLVGPAHVSTVIGTAPYEPIAERYVKPVVVAGFEPLDILQAVLMLVRQCNDGRHQVENQYTRVVTPQGNVKAQADMAEIFRLRDTFEWRGLGWLPESALAIADPYADFDAERRFDIPRVAAADNPACECGTILRGLKRPAECRLFGTACTPETPIGACMVSSEGACAAHWSYGRFRQRGTSPS